jgi:hypothetical protein
LRGGFKVRQKRRPQDEQAPATAREGTTLAAQDGSACGGGRLEPERPCHVRQEQDFGEDVPVDGPSRRGGYGLGELGVLHALLGIESVGDFPF